jgi:predicted O-methyltransferase YrrM
MEKGREWAGGGMARDLKAAFEATEGMVSFDEFRLLYELARGVRQGAIVEVGSYRGRSTVALGLGSLDGHRAPVFAIDPHEEFTGVLGGRFGPEDRAAFYRAMLETGCDRVVRLVNLASEVVASGFDRKVALLFVDGDHRDEAVRRDFHAWLPHLESGAFVAFDDSLDPKLGPARLIGHLVATGLFAAKAVAGKLTVLELCASAAQAG